MFYCKKCGGEFEIYDKQTEMHGFCSPPFEESFLCPYCGSNNIEEKEKTYCKCCGIKLRNNEKVFCSDECRKHWKLLLRKELKRRKEYESSPLIELIKEVEIYNKANKTNLSYGQYVDFIKTKKKASDKKCEKKRKNT